MMKRLQHRGGIAAWALLAGALAAGCGGGGSDAPAAAGGPPPVQGSFAGTYSCTGTAAQPILITAVLPTASGDFSSCSGSALAGEVTIACTGSIAADGTFDADGQDSHGNTMKFTGTATSSGVSGLVQVLGIYSGDFSCTR